MVVYKRLDRTEDITEDLSAMIMKGIQFLTTFFLLLLLICFFGKVPNIFIAQGKLLKIARQISKFIELIRLK